MIVVGGALVGVAIPVAWFLVGTAAGWDNAERYAAFIGGIAVSYLLLAAGAGLLVSRLRLRQKRRETNLPWHRSLTEWRDVPGEFNHLLEELLVTGAAITLVICLALLLVALVSAVASA